MPVTSRPPPRMTGAYRREQLLGVTKAIVDEGDFTPVSIEAFDERGRKVLTCREK